MRAPYAYDTNCNLLRPLIKIAFLLVPFGNIVVKIKGIPKETTIQECKALRSLKSQGVQLLDNTANGFHDRLPLLHTALGHTVATAFG